MRLKTRLSLIVLVAVLALPLALGSNLTEAAKFRTVKKTFSNTGQITVNSFGSASPFPSLLQVSGFKRGTISDVNLVLVGLSHEVPADLDVLLVGPTNRDSHNALVMSDVGVESAKVNETLRLDDEAARTMPGMSSFPPGKYRPTNFNDNFPDIFDSTHAPMPTGNTPLKIFDGMNPNGEWQLFIRDDAAEDSGSVSGGWRLEITVRVRR
jgi:subtilisin-like proprotein convertase family protein